jgi:hypothetical protein
MTNTKTKPSASGRSYQAGPITQHKRPVSSGNRPDRRIVWEWNLRLLLTSAIALVVVVATLSSLYVWQSSRLAEGILSRARAANQSGNLSEQASWLARYVNLVPGDVEAQVELALAVDASVRGSADLDRARRTLTTAIAACAATPAHHAQKQILREKLISRLVQMGAVWAHEAEKQVVALNRPADDPLASKWMAQALVSQFTGMTYKPRDAQKYDEQTQPWRWLSTQPPGQVLYRAWSLNPQDVDLGSRLIAACLENPEWFRLENQALAADEIEKTAREVVDHLEQIADGRAQWTVYIYLASTNASNLAKEKLQSAVDGAMSRLAQHTVAHKNRNLPTAAASRLKVPWRHSPHHRLS